MPDGFAHAPEDAQSEIARFASVDAAAVLERLAGTPLIERGAVTIISVEAIAEQAGPRWSRKRDDVWEYVERKCDEHLSFQDIRQRINETDFLIAMTTEEGVAAQATSLKILEEVLEFFVGAANTADLRVRAVTGIDRDGVRTAEIDLTRVAAARTSGAAQRLEQAVDAREARRRNPISFVTVAGERVRVDFAIEAVVSLNHQVTAALRIQPTVTAIQRGIRIRTKDFDRLDDDDVGYIDRAALAYGALFMPKNPHSDPALIIPTSFRTMGGRKGRNALISTPGATPDQMRQSVFLELVDVDVGTPAARLAEVVGLLNQLSRGVMARLLPHRDALAPVRGVRLRGLTFDVRDLAYDEVQLNHVLGAIALQARGKSPAVIAQGLSAPGWIRIVHRAGFTHAAEASAPATRQTRLSDLT